MKLFDKISFKLYKLFKKSRYSDGFFNLNVMIVFLYCEM